MSTAHVVVTVLTAAWVGFSALSTYRRARWVVEPLADYGVPRSWWPWLATVKALGAAGLLVGLVLPVIGVAAAIGLVLYFAGAVVTVLRAGAFSHVPYPLLYMAPTIATLALGLAA